VIAGHDTTSTTFTWGLKFLSDHPTVQSKLRDALHEALPDANLQARQPTTEEIVRSHIPYVDAVQEEIHRKSLTAPLNPRMTLKDTVILGYHVPKGTDVLLMNNGPGFLMPTMDIKEDVRSESSRKSAGRIGEWDPSDMGDFKPERWLTKDEQGQVQFNPTAGPSLPFGAGPRGCYGKRLAYLQLKCLLTLIVWNFELGYAGDKLANYKAEDLMTHQPQQCYLKLKVL
jgi:cytochrome P450